MISSRTVTATLLGSGYNLDVLAGSLTLDEAMSPFVGGTITIANPGLQVLALLGQPPGQAPPRIRLTVTRSDGTTLSASLYVQARQIVAETGEVGINLVNAEALLEDYSPTAPINLAAYQYGVRAICGRVLTLALGMGNITPVMATPTSDAVFTTYSEVKNMIQGGSFEAATGLWTAGNATLSQNTTAAGGYGTYSLKIAPSSTSSDSYAQQEIQVSPGRTYTVSGTVRMTSTPSGSSNARAWGLYVEWTPTGGAPQALPGALAGGQPANGVATRRKITFTVPWNADSVRLRLYNGLTNSSANNANVFWDGIMLTEGDGTETNTTNLAYFDGSTPDTAAYNYDWDGDAGLSSSTRTPVVDRSPDILVWQPGTGGMSFLQPILQAAGLRLFQNIDGTWYIADDSYRVPGQARVAYGYNLYTATDLVSRTATQTDGLPLFADAVVLNYEWTDIRFGETKTASDVATSGTPTKAYVPPTMNTPYPGPGRAAYVLRRLKARTRQLQVTGTPDYSVRPGQQAVITTLDGGVQSGYVDAVTWDIGDDSMQVVTKGLVASLPGSVGRAPASQTIGSVTGTIAQYTN